MLKFIQIIINCFLSPFGILKYQNCQIIMIDITDIPIYCVRNAPCVSRFLFVSTSKAMLTSCKIPAIVNIRNVANDKSCSCFDLKFQTSWLVSAPHSGNRIIIDKICPTSVTSSFSSALDGQTEQFSGSSLILFPTIPPQTQQATRIEIIITT